MKKQYIAPKLKCVEFKVELGFIVSSLTQGTTCYDDDDEELDDSPWIGYHDGNNEDWD